ncbi:hypothetical protein KKE03_03360 [Patescibacteria group bacterium]|nr:hypothetical protein [Patescibacteria group bacterium]
MRERRIGKQRLETTGSGKEAIINGCVSERWSIKKIVAVGIGTSLVMAAAVAAFGETTLVAGSIVSGVPMEVLANNPAALKLHEGMIATTAGMCGLSAVVGGAILVVGRITQS